MKPAPFEFVGARTVDEAVQARAESDYNVVLAGGQSLIPAMNFRLVQPEVVIDLSRVSELRGLKVDDTSIRVGAMVTQRQAELDAGVAAANPLLTETLGHVAHSVIRSRGTVVGSIAHADAAAELPALLTALDGDVTAVSIRGSRSIPAGELFDFHLTTTLAEDEIITEVRIPTLRAGDGYAFEEFARRHGDFAQAGVCVVLGFNNGTCDRAAISGCGIASRPVRLTEAENALVGGTVGTDDIARAQEAARDYVTAEDDMTTTRAYRRHLLAGLVGRAVGTATARAKGRK